MDIIGIPDPHKNLSGSKTLIIIGSCSRKNNRLRLPNNAVTITKNNFLSTGTSADNHFFPFKRSELIKY